MANIKQTADTIFMILQTKRTLRHHWGASVMLQQSNHKFRDSVREDRLKKILLNIM